MEREGQGSAVYTEVDTNVLRIGLDIYSGCVLVQNRLRILISGKVILKICVKNM